MLDYKRHGLSNPAIPESSVAMSNDAHDNGQTSSLWSKLALHSESHTGNGVESAAPIQRKATVSSPGDPLEREADDVADQVMRMAEPGSIGSAPVTVQRKCAACDEEDQSVIQTKRATENASEGLDAGTAVSTAERGGTPLSAETRSFFEPRFGQDFSDVRIHADGEAASSARAVQARAYTFGNDIVFGANQYAPATTQGKQLLAHELTHVIQQGGGGKAVQRDVEEGTDETVPATDMDDSEGAEPMDKKGGCKAERNITRRIRNFIDLDITIPEGCSATMTFTAIWVPVDGGGGVECCSGAETYSVSRNGKKATSMPVGANVCGDNAQHIPGKGQMTTGSGRQQLHISVNRNGCTGVAMDLTLNVKIH